MDMESTPKVKPKVDHDLLALSRGGGGLEQPSFRPDMSF